VASTIVKITPLSGYEVYLAFPAKVLEIRGVLQKAKQHPGACYVWQASGCGWSQGSDSRCISPHRIREFI